MKWVECKDSKCNTVMELYIWKKRLEDRQYFLYENYKQLIHTVTVFIKEYNIMIILYK